MCYSYVSLHALLLPEAPWEDHHEDVEIYKAWLRARARYMPEMNPEAEMHDKLYWYVIWYQGRRYMHAQHAENIRTFAWRTVKDRSVMQEKYPQLLEALERQDRSQITGEQVRATIAQRMQGGE